MIFTSPRRSIVILAFVDALLLLAVTLVGFARHESSAGGGRWLTTFLPLAVAWSAASIPLGLYDIKISHQPAQIWRVLLAAILAGSLAALLRALWLGSVVIPIFALVLSAITAAGLGLWRLLWSFLASRAS